MALRNCLKIKKQPHGYVIKSSVLQNPTTFTAELKLFLMRFRQVV